MRREPNSGSKEPVEMDVVPKKTGTGDPKSGNEVRISMGYAPETAEK